MQFEDILVELPDVLALGHPLQILLQLHQLVVLPTIIGQNGNPVLQLEDVRIRRIVDQRHTTQIPIHNPQILRIDVLMDLDAVLPIQPMLDELSVWVDLVKHHIRVGFMACCEGNDLIVFCHPFEETDCVGTDRYVGLGC